tara:strand:- start:4440 stop:4925 length:486 start_codon:yes stop_codon:yes gene_type:complete
MTQFLKPYKIEELQKTLPKKHSHIKEDAKVKFIKKAMSLYRISDDFGRIDFNKSTYDGIDVDIIFTPSSPKIELTTLIHDVMDKWYFSNMAKNENVYFYRFINLFRAELTTDEWNVIDVHLNTTDQLNLRENYRQYADYRRKLDEIDVLLTSENFNARENY